MANNDPKNALHARLAAQRAVIETLYPFLPTPEGLDDGDEWKARTRDATFSPDDHTLRSLLFGQAKSHPSVAKLGVQFDGEVTVVDVKGRLLAHLLRNQDEPEVRSAELTIQVGWEKWRHRVPIRFQDEDNLYLDLGTENDLNEILRPARAAVVATPEAPILIGITLSYDEVDPTPE